MAGAIALAWVIVCAPGVAVAGQSDSGPVCSAYAKVPLPSEAVVAGPAPTKFPGCAAYKWYRGIGRPLNLSEARECAWKERAAQLAHLPQNPEVGTSWFVGGSLILADLYANGAGVERKVPLAMRFVCESEEQTAELAAKDLLAGGTPIHTRGWFEFCDYAATTFSMNFCGEYAAEVEDDRRSRQYRGLRASMTPEQQRSFDRLLAAERVYVDTHAREVYQGGSIRGVRTMGSQEILDSLFHAEVVHLERGRWPVFSDRLIGAADGMERREYAKKLLELRAQKPTDLEDGLVTAGDVQQVEASWIRYREAWTAFARARYPGHVDAVRAQVALDRYRLLKTIFVEDE